MSQNLTTYIAKTNFKKAWTIKLNIWDSITKEGNAGIGQRKHWSLLHTSNFPSIIGYVLFSFKQHITSELLNYNFSVF